MKKNTFNQINLLRNSLLVSSGTILGRLSLVLSQILLARFLGPNQYGLFILGWTILRLNGIFSLFGIDKAVIFFCSGKEFDLSTNKYITIAITLSTLISLSSCSLIYFNSNYISLFFSSINLNSYLPSFSVITFIYVLNQIIAAITRINNQMIQSVFIKDLVQPIIMIILILTLEYYNILNLQNVLNILKISFIIPFLLGIILIKKNLTQFYFVSFNLKSLNKFIKYSYSVFSAGIFSMLMIWVDRIMIGIYCTNSDLGVYQIATQSTMIITMFIASMAMAISPSISKLYKDSNYDMIQQYFSASIRWSCYICLPLIIILFLNTNNFIEIIYGNEFLKASATLKVLSIAKLFHLICGAVGIALIMTNNNKIWFRNTIIFFVINVFLNYLLIPRYGIFGAAISTCISISLLFLTGRLIVKKILRIPLFDKSILKILLSFILTFYIITNLKIFFQIGIIPFFLFALLTYFLFVVFILVSKVYKNDYIFLKN